MFLEGQDDGLLHYDGGEFYQWLVDCRSGAPRWPLIASLICKGCGEGVGFTARG